MADRGDRVISKFFLFMLQCGSGWVVSAAWVAVSMSFFQEFLFDSSWVS
jgi:hypothetical protein